MSNPFDRNPYRIPPPWNPGYANPQNVDDEGLERRAFTTSWAPRGSFDNPKVGTAGYAVPGYVQDERYGQGAFVTRYAPRGTYYGPKVPHWIDEQTSKVVGRKPLPGGATQLQIRTLAGLEEQTMGAAPLTAYSHKSAAALIDTVRMMPDSMRTAQLRAMLDKIDPGLYARAEELAKAEAKVGVTPLVALERGLAAAMSVGLGKELVELGRSKRIGKRTQLGAIATLGATPAEGECSADGKYIFKAGSWQRKGASDVCGSTGTAVGTTRQGQSGVKAAPVAQTAFLHIGPFLIPMAARVTWHSKSLTEEQVNWLRGAGAATLKAFADAGWKPLNLRTVLNSGQFPLVKFTMPEGGGPEAGKEFGLYLSGSFYEFGDYKMEWRPYTEPPKPEQKSWWKRAWQWVKKAAVAIVDAVKDAAKWVAAQGCKLMKDPQVAQLVGGAIGGAVGPLIGIPGPVSGKLGAAGGQIISAACQDDQPPETPPETPPEGGADEKPSGGSSLMPLLLLGGAGLAAFLVLGKKGA